MNETTNFISENAMNFKEIDVEKTKLFKICQKKKQQQQQQQQQQQLKWPKGLTNYREFSRPT